MRPGDYLKTGLACIATFLLGLVWQQNWWALAAGAFGVVLMAVVCASKHGELNARHGRLLLNKELECQRRVRKAQREARGSTGSPSRAESREARSSVVESLDDTTPVVLAKGGRP